MILYIFMPLDLLRLHGYHGYAGSKVVCTVHGLDWQRQKWSRLASMYLRFSEWSSYHFADRTITVSRTLKEYYDSHYKGSVNYIPNGVNIPSDMSSDIIRGKI